MINLTFYREYIENVAGRMTSRPAVLPVAVDKDMGKRIQSLPTGSVTVFLLPPGATSEARSADAFRESNECVLFVMEKYDTQRRRAFEVLESSQPVIEELKSLLLADLSRGCAVMKIEVDSINTLPETEFFAGFAGWSLGFKVRT